MSQPNRALLLCDLDDVGRPILTIAGTRDPNLIAEFGKAIAKLVGKGFEVRPAVPSTQKGGSK